MTNLRVVEVVSDAPPLVEFDYGLIADPIQRDWAESAAGFITFGLGQAVVKVLEAGNLLIEAQTRLAHGEYLPWVEQACGLKPRYAQQLAKAAQWANAQHVAHLDGITDTATLFLLSADATPEEVRQWALERCAAGDPPSRKEVQERKRNSSEAGRQRTVIDEALKAFRLSDEARSLAANALRITTRQLMDELGADELPKGKQHVTDTATFVKDQEGWIKFTMQQPIDVPATATRTQADLFPDAPQADEEIVPLAEAAARLGKKLVSFRMGLTPSQLDKRGNPKGNGWTAYPHPTRGKCILRKVA
jgi:hypothetical protein